MPTFLLTEGGGMPRFFFDLYQAEDFTADSVGTEFASVEQSYLEAIKAAQDMFSELLKLRRDPRRCRFEVRGEEADVLFVVPFREVLDCCVDNAPIPLPSLFKVFGHTHEYVRRTANDLKQEIEHSRRILHQSRKLLAIAAQVLTAD